MLNSLRHRLLRPLLIKPPFSELTRKISSNFLNLNFEEKFEKPHLNENEIVFVKNLNKDGYIKSDINKFGIKDIFNNISEAYYDLGFPKSGNIKEIKNEKVLNFLKSEIANKNIKNYKIKITDFVDKSILNLDAISESFAKIAMSYLNVPVKRSYSEVLFDHNILNFESAKETQLYHRDYNGILFLKIFIYLSDVDLSNGPYCYVSESHNKEFMKKFKIKKNIIRKNVRHDNKEVENLLGNHEIKFIGKAGDVIISDTTGLHRGITPNKDKFRMLLSIMLEPKNNFLSFTD